MTRTLDKHRPYGTVYGDLEFGAAYEQDGCLFNGQGRMVRDEKGSRVDPSAEPEPETDTASRADEGEGDDEKTLQEKLEALHPMELKKLLEDQGLEVATGPGSKAANIETLLAAASGE